MLLEDILYDEKQMLGKDMERTSEQQILWEIINKLGSREKEIMIMRFGLLGGEEKTQKADETIAKKTVEVLKKDIEDGFEHVAMARVESIRRAEQVSEIYNQIAPEFKPLMINNEMNKKDTLCLFVVRRCSSAGLLRRLTHANSKRAKTPKTPKTRGKTPQKSCPFVR